MGIDIWNWLWGKAFPWIETRVEYWFSRVSYCLETIQSPWRLLCSGSKHWGFQRGTILYWAGKTLRKISIRNGTFASHVDFVGYGNVGSFWGRFRRFTINYSSTFIKTDISQNVDFTCKVDNVQNYSFIMLQLFMILKSVQPLYLAGSKIMFKFSPDYNVLIYIDSGTRRPPRCWVPIYTP